MSANVTEVIGCHPYEKKAMAKSQGGVDQKFISDRAVQGFCRYACIFGVRECDKFVH